MSYNDVDRHISPPKTAAYYARTLSALPHTFLLDTNNMHVIIHQRLSKPLFQINTCKWPLGVTVETLSVVRLFKGSTQYSTFASTASVFHEASLCPRFFPPLGEKKPDSLVYMTVTNQSPLEVCTAHLHLAPPSVYNGLRVHIAWCLVTEGGSLLKDSLTMAQKCSPHSNNFQGYNWCIVHDGQYLTIICLRMGRNGKYEKCYTIYVKMQVAPWILWTWDSKTGYLQVNWC